MQGRQPEGIQVTDPLIMSEMTPDESLEPCSLLERWESEEGFDYLSFGDFIAMATQATKKTPVVETTKSSESIDIGDLTILNKRPDNAVGMLYVTPIAMEHIEDQAQRLPMQLTNALFWACVYASHDFDHIPSYDETFTRGSDLAYSPKLWVFEGPRSEGYGTPRLGLSKYAHDKVIENGLSVLRCVALIETWQSCGYEGSRSRGDMYQECVNKRKDSIQARKAEKDKESALQRGMQQEATAAIALPI